MFSPFKDRIDDAYGSLQAYFKIEDNGYFKSIYEYSWTACHMAQSIQVSIV